MKNFTNKRVLITGAGSGIGKLMALKFSKRMATVICIDINETAVSEVVREIKTAGGKAFYFVADVSNINSVKKLKNDVGLEVGKIDILINNAGVVYGGEFEKESLERHFLTYNINVNGVVAMTHLFFDDLRDSIDANIVNIASASGMIGLPFGTTYSSSKWAVIGFSESLRLELVERGIRNVHVTTVCPSYITTGMFHGVKAPKLVPWLKPEMIVEKIIWGIEKNKAFVKEPFIVKTVDLLKGLLPLVVFDYVVKLIGVSTSMMHWKGRK